MGLSCSCPSVYGNTGLPNCKTVFGVARDFWFVPKYGADASRNTISTSDLTSNKLNQAYFIGKFNDNDTEDRWAPVRNVKQLNIEKGETNYFDFDDGERQRLSEGARTFTFMLPNVDAKFIQNLQQSGCGDLGVYIKDEDNNIIGNASVADELRPMELAQDSLDVRMQYATDGQPQGIMVTFTLKKTELDRDLGVISNSMLDTDVDFEAFGLGGVMNLNGTISSITTTTFTATILTEYGNQLDLTPFVAGALADFYLYDETNATEITISSVDAADAENGVYDFTIPLATSADVLALYIKPETKNGYEMLRTEIVIP